MNLRGILSDAGILLPIKSAIGSEIAASKYSAVPTPVCAPVPAHCRAGRWRAAALLLCLAYQPAWTQVSSLSVTETVTGNSLPLTPAVTFDDEGFVNSAEFATIIEPEVDAATVVVVTATGSASFLDGNDNALTDADSVAAGFQLTSLAYGRNTIKIKTTNVNNENLEHNYTLTIWRARTPLFCKRTTQVRDVIVGRVSGVDHCANITARHLAQITWLTIDSLSVTALRSGDFAGLSELSSLGLINNDIRSFPANLFDDLAGLETLVIRQINRYSH